MKYKAFIGEAKEVDWYEHNLFYCNFTHRILWRSNDDVPQHDCCKPVFLYICDTKAEIITKDYFICGKEAKINKTVLSMSHNMVTDKGDYKIIASTNPELSTVPAIHSDFVEKYGQEHGNVKIKEVMLFGLHSPELGELHVSIDGKNLYFSKK